MQAKETAFEEERLQFERAIAQAKKDFLATLKNIPMLSPKAIDDKIQALGYRGQDHERKALALMAYRHIRRIKKIHLDGKDRRDYLPKQNVLMIGPTGCGKTFLVELLFENIFKLPTVIVDVTSLTESGYIGDDTKSVLARLINAAHNNLFLASCGVVCLDEFDKLASASSNARFAGQGTTKDVSGYGVQRELLTMLEGKSVVVALDYGFSAYGPRVELSTQDIPFIACGAFSGIDELSKLDHKKFGFGATNEQIAPQEMQEVGILQKYGFIPELIGRFARVVHFSKLSTATLRRILLDNVLPKFFHEFNDEGLELEVTHDALDYLIRQTERRGTGARGLNTELTTAIEQAAFETFMNGSAVKVCITASSQGLLSNILK